MRSCVAASATGLAASFALSLTVAVPASRGRRRLFPSVSGAAAQQSLSSKSTRAVAVVVEAVVAQKSVASVVLVVVVTVASVELVVVVVELGGNVSGMFTAMAREERRRSRTEG